MSAPKPRTGGNQPYDTKTKTPSKRLAPDQGSKSTTTTASFGPSAATVMYTPPPRGRSPIDSLGEPMTWDGSAGLWRSNRLPTETKVSNAKTTRLSHSRPGGRTPHDSKGKPMQWCGESGLWKSTIDQCETKQSNSKYPRSSPTAVPVVQPVIAPSPGAAPEAQAVTDEAIALSAQTSIGGVDSGEAPMQDTGEDQPDVPVTFRPGGRAPRDSNKAQMEWDGQHVHVEVLVPDAVMEMTEPSAQLLEPVPDDQVQMQVQLEVQEHPPAAGESVVAQTVEPAVAIAESTVQAPVAAAPTGITTRPVGFAPHDSTGLSMDWNREKALWNIPGEAREPNIIKTPPAFVVGTDAPASAAIPTASPTPAAANSTDPPEFGVAPQTDIDVEPTPQPAIEPGSVGEKAEIGVYLSDVQDFAGEPAISVIDPAATPLRPVGKSQNDRAGKAIIWDEVVKCWTSRTNMLRPVGRAPNDSAGKAMIWDEVAKCWTSRTNLLETKVPAHGASAAGAAVGANAGGNSVARPVGRTPHDSRGEKMIWNNGCWRSKSNPEEVRTTKKRS